MSDPYQDHPNVSPGIDSVWGSAGGQTLWIPQTTLNGGSQPVFDVMVTYGAKADGTTDDTTAINNAITAAYNAGGGIVLFRVSASPYLVSGSLTIPNDGNTDPAQPPISLLAAAPGPNDGRWNGTRNHGVILDMRSTTGPAKIDTRGRGTLRIEGITFTQQGSSADTNPFIQTTNTTLIVRNNGFYGHDSISGASCVQDAIVLGGTTNSAGKGSDNFFQGYGTVVAGNYFSRIRRGIYGRAACNAIAVRENTFSTTCGAGATAAAIDFNPGTGTAWGNDISSNTIEMSNYTYGIRYFGNCRENVNVGNTFWDNGGSAYCYRFEADATNVTSPAENVILGIHSDGAATQWVSDSATVAGAFYLVARSIYGRPTFKNAVTFSDQVTVSGTQGIVVSPTGAVLGLSVTDDASSTSNVIAQFGDSSHGMWQVKNGGVGVTRRSLIGFDNAGNQQLVLDPLNKKITVGVAGPTLSSGAGTPEGAVTAPIGSLYMRTDGGASTSLYVKESGTGNTGWIAK